MDASAAIYMDASAASGERRFFFSFRISRKLKAKLLKGSALIETFQQDARAARFEVGAPRLTREPFVGHSVRSSCADNLLRNVIVHQLAQGEWTEIRDGRLLGNYYAQQHCLDVICATH